jgi:hypothetical protein
MLLVVALHSTPRHRRHVFLAHFFVVATTSNIICRHRLQVAVLHVAIYAGRHLFALSSLPPSL